MAYKIKQSDLFLKDVTALLPYLEKEWGHKAASDFQRILDGKLFHIRCFPESGSITLRNPGVRKFVVTKRNKIYYKVIGKTIYLLRLYDTRKNPKRNKYE